MLGQKSFALSAVFLLVTISFVSMVESEAVDQVVSSSIDEKIETIKSNFPLIQKTSFFDKIKKLFIKYHDGSNVFDSSLEESLFNLKNANFSQLIGNFTSLDVIAALFGSLIFLLITQPIFLQFIVETGNQFLFIVILVSLIGIESFQKIFALRIIGFWDTYVVNDVDGIWNFFSIVFFSSYVKIYLSYLPTFIIQYSNVLTKAFFYALMFTIPILFNVCIADSIDMIDWNRDESITLI